MLHPLQKELAKHSVVKLWAGQMGLYKSYIFDSINSLMLTSNLVNKILFNIVYQ